MDQDALRRTLAELDERGCPFEKGILTNEAGCRLARRLCIGEREAVICTRDAAWYRCLAFLDLARQQARFVLKATGREAALTHANAKRVQVGGLRGVRATLRPDASVTSPIEDIDGLLEDAARSRGGFAGLPWAAVIQQVAAYRSRRPARRR